MIEFNECDVIVNGQGFLAEGASISQENALQPLYLVGFQGATQIPSGPRKTLFDISYIGNVYQDVNFDAVSRLKNEDIPSPFRVEIGGIIGLCYLEKYSLRAVPNEPIKVDVSYISFNLLSGSLQPKRGTVDYELTPEEIGHGWTTYVTSSGNYLNVPTYEFQYDVSFNWNPVYAMFTSAVPIPTTRMFPSQVILMGGTEQLSLVREEFITIQFSGEDVRTKIFSAHSENDISLKGISFADENKNGLSINLEGAQVVSDRIDFSPNSYSKVRVSISKSF